MVTREQKRQNERIEWLELILKKEAIPESANSLELLDLFALHLQNKGLKNATINKHMGNLSLFLDPYLLIYCDDWEEGYGFDSEEAEYLGYNGEMDEFDPEYLPDLRKINSYAIEDFLGDFCIRKVMGFKKTNISSFLTTFKKFYTFLYQYDVLSEELYEGVIEIWGESNELMKRYDKYYNDDGDGDWGDEGGEDWDDEEDGDWGSKKDEFWSEYEGEGSGRGRIEEENNNKSNNIEELKIVFGEWVNFTRHEIEKNAISIPKTTIKYIEDFLSFIKFIETTPKLKVSKAKQTFTRKDILLCLEKFHNKVELKPFFFQWDATQFHVFYVLVQKLQMISIEKNFEVKIIPKNVEKILTSKEEAMGQLTVLFYTLWDVIAWRTLLKPSVGGRPEWAQLSRNIIITLFSEVQANIEYPYYDTLIKIQEKNYENNNHIGEDTGGSSSYDLFNQLANLMGSFSTFELHDGGIHNGVMCQKILPTLEHMGLVELKFDILAKRRKYPNLKSFKVTEFGKIFFQNYRDTIGVFLKEI